MDSFGCPPATLRDNGPKFLVHNNNPWNALSINFVQSYGYWRGQRDNETFRLHCSNPTNPAVIPPGGKREVDLDRSVYMAFLEWHAPNSQGGWSYISKAPPAELYKV